jgi:hypothetical protein
VQDGLAVWGRVVLVDEWVVEWDCADAGVGDRSATTVTGWRGESGVARYVLQGGPHAGFRGTCPSSTPWQVIIRPHPAALSKVLRYERRHDLKIGGRLIFEFTGMLDRESYNVGIRDAEREPPVLWVED